MKFSWPLFFASSGILFLVKLVIIPVFGWLILGEAMSAGWAGGSHSSPFWVLPVLITLLVLCPLGILCMFLSQPSESLLAIAVLAEIAGTFIYGAIFTRIFFLLFRVTKPETNRDETSLPSESY
jgi:hypothetical protein